MSDLLLLSNALQAQNAPKFLVSETLKPEVVFDPFVQLRKLSALAFKTLEI